MFFLVSSRTQGEIRVNVEYTLQVSVMPLVLYFSPASFFYCIYLHTVILWKQLKDLLHWSMLLCFICNTEQIV